MYPPGTAHPSSTQSSMVNLPGADPVRRRSSTIGSVTSAAGSTNSQGNSSVTGHIEASDSAYMYMEIQLYQLEREFYLVDFKCAGYESLVEVPDDSQTSDGHAMIPEEGEDPKASGPQSSHGSATEFKHGNESGNNLGSATHLQRQPKNYKGTGRKNEEKEVSSPFPFLDLASKLIIQLAEAD
jgi:carbon catabolite-derepressing protein kinase